MVIDEVFASSTGPAHLVCGICDAKRGWSLADARKQEVSPDGNEKERASGLNRSDVLHWTIEEELEKNRKSCDRLEEKPPTHFLIYYTAFKKQTDFFPTWFIHLTL